MTTTSAIAPTTTTFGGLTAEQWRERAHESRRSADESFDRCDTDGFLSQWAAGQMASRYLALAKIAEDGGRALRAVPVDPTTREIIPGRWVETKYGRAYLTADGRWLNESSARDPKRYAAAHLRKGFVLAWASVPMLLDRRDMIAYPVKDQAQWTVTDQDVQR